MCVCFAWLVDVDGDLALIDPGKPVLERERERRVWSRLEGKLQRESKDDTQASSSSSKPITVLKPVSIEDILLLQHHNLVFDLTVLVPSPSWY